MMTSAQALAAMMAPAAGRLRWASALSLAAALLWPLQAALVAYAFAGLLNGVQPWATVPGFAALGILRALLSHHAEGVLFTAGQHIVTTTRTRIVQRTALTLGDTSAGALAALAGEKLEALLPYITRYAPARARVTVLPLLILLLAFWHSWAVGVVFLITGPLIPVFMALVGRTAEQASQRQMAETGRINDLLVERLSALLDIRLLGATDRVAQSFATAADRLRAQTMAVLRVAFLSSAVLELFSAIGVAMVAVYVGFSLLGQLHFGSYDTTLTPAAGIFLLLLAPEFYQPLRDLSAAWHDKAQALAVAAEVQAWQETELPPLIGTGTPTQRLHAPPTIRTTSLTFRTHDRLIHYPDFTVTPGEKLALIGPSGTGKTTLLRLMAGLMAPTSGLITVAGQTLSPDTADAWRAGLGWMPQSPHFLTGSVLHNLTLGQGGDPGPALHMAAVDSVIAALPHGLNTQLGQSGGGLSGGEARRLTLARALHARPAVLLADEPTADLDAATAQLVTNGLLALSASGCTLIIATHDPILAAKMDRVIQIGGAT